MCASVFGWFFAMVLREGRWVTLSFQKERKERAVLTMFILDSSCVDYSVSSQGGRMEATRECKDQFALGCRVFMAAYLSLKRRMR